MNSFIKTKQTLSKIQAFPIPQGILILDKFLSFESSPNVVYIERLFSDNNYSIIIKLTTVKI